MSPQIATLAYTVLILGLFWLDRDTNSRTSKALWIPSLWLLINGSRPVSVWLETGPTIAQADQYLDGSPLDAFVFGSLMLGGFVVLFQRRDQVGRFLRANSAVILFFTYCAISAIWSEYPFVAFKRSIKAVGDVVMILIVLTDRDPVTAIKRLLSRAGFILIPYSILFIKYYPDLGRSYNPWTWIPMFCGVTMFKNLLGMICLVCGIGSVWYFASIYKDRKAPDRKRHLLAHGALLAMSLWLFWIADSMTSLSCFMMGTAVIVVTEFRAIARRIALVHLLVASIVGVAVFALFLDTGGSLVSSLGRDPTLTGRTAIWTVVLSLVKNPLFGTGYESFWLGDRLQKVWDGLHENGIQEAHDGYLEVYLNLGWVGVAFLSGIIIAGYRNVIAVFRQDQEAGRIRLAFFVVGVVYSLTEAGFRMMAPVWMAFLLAVVAVPLSSLKKTTAIAPRVPATIRSQPEYVSAPVVSKEYV